MEGQDAAGRHENVKKNRLGICYLSSARAGLGLDGGAQMDLGNQPDKSI